MARLLAGFSFGRHPAPNTESSTRNLTAQGLAW